MSKDIDLMGFFDEVTFMRVIELPRNETGKVGDCWCFGLSARAISNIRGSK